MPRVAAERPAQDRQRLARGHAAAGLVGERDHTIDVGEIGQRIVAGERVLLEDIGDHARDMRAAIHRRQDADIVAGRHPSIRTADAVEGRGQVEVWHRPNVDAKGIVLGKIAHAAILGMDVLARRNRRGRKADDLAVTTDRFTDRNGADRNLVAGGNALARGHAIGHHHAGRKARARDQHAVIGVQSNDGCWRHVVSPLGSAYALPSESLRVCATCILA